MRFATTREIADAGHDVRAWCFRCARGGIVPARHLDLPLADAARRYRCTGCGLSDEVLLVPAFRAKHAQNDEPEGEITAERFVAAIYHAFRSQRKRKPYVPFEVPWYWGRG